MEVKERESCDFFVVKRLFVLAVVFCYFSIFIGGGVYGPLKKIKNSKSLIKIYSFSCGDWSGKMFLFPTYSKIRAKTSFKIFLDGGGEVLLERKIPRLLVDSANCFFVLRSVSRAGIVITHKELTIYNAEKSKRFRYPPEFDFLEQPTSPFLKKKDALRI